VFEAEYRLMDLRRAAAKQWATMDLLVLPTTGTIYTHDQVASDPVKLNTNLGYYTNFVNLMDLAAVAAPSRLPFERPAIWDFFHSTGLFRRSSAGARASLSRREDSAS